MQPSFQPFPFPSVDENTTQALQAFWQQQLKAASQQTENLLPAQRAFMQLAQDWLARPEDALKQTQTLWQQNLQLWQSAAQGMANGQGMGEVAPADKGDRRFTNPQWQQNPVLNLMRQSYLIFAQHLLSAAASSRNLSAKEQHQAQFFTRLMVRAKP